MAGAAKDHRTNHLLPVIVRHRDPATSAFRHRNNKPAEAILRTRRRRVDYLNHRHVYDIAPLIIIATEVSTPTPPSSSGPLANTGGIQHQGVIIVRSNKIRAAAIRAEGVRQQNGDASKKVSDGHGRRHRESRP